MPRILAVSDSVDRALYDNFNVERWKSEKIDLLVSCGDLSAEYLSYLVSRFDVPLFYVPGNHDEAYQTAPPEGAEDIDGKLVRWNGLRILGLGGSPNYNDGAYQYAEWQMKLRIFALKPRLLLAGGVDLVVAHAPPQFCPLAHTPACPTPAGTNRPSFHPTASGHDLCQDAPDRAHRGFPAFTDLIHTYHPPVFLHGHSHLNYGQAKRCVSVGDTKVIDVHGYYILDL